MDPFPAHRKKTLKCLCVVVSGVVSPLIMYNQAGDECNLKEVVFFLKPCTYHRADLFTIFVCRLSQRYVYQTHTGYLFAVYT